MLSREEHEDGILTLSEEAGLCDSEIDAARTLIKIAFQQTELLLDIRDLLLHPPLPEPMDWASDRSEPLGEINLAVPITEERP